MSIPFDTCRPFTTQPTPHTRRAEEEKDADIFKADHVALPDFVKDMRLKGLREKLTTVEGLLQVGARSGCLLLASQPAE